MSPTYEQPPLHTTTSGGEPGERWVTIWSRLPIEALPSLSDASRSVAARVVARDVGPIVVVGTVLRIVAALGSSDGAASEGGLQRAAAMAGTHRASDQEVED